MKTVRLFFLLGSVLYSCVSFAQENGPGTSSVVIHANRDPEWSSYRDAYDFSKQLEKFDKPKNFVEIHYLLRPKDSEVNTTNLKLKIIGETTDIDMPVDIRGRAKIPVNETAFKEDAQIIANRGRGSFRFLELIQIKPTENGYYELADLKKACEQVREFYIYAHHYLSLNAIKMRNKKCIGIEFASLVDRDVAPEVYFENEQGVRELLITKHHSSFFMFSDGLSTGRIVAINPSLTISIVVTQ